MKHRYSATRGRGSLKLLSREQAQHGTPLKLRSSQLLGNDCRGLFLHPERVATLLPYAIVRSECRAASKEPAMMATSIPREDEEPPKQSAAVPRGSQSGLDSIRQTASLWSIARPSFHNRTKFSSRLVRTSTASSSSGGRLCDSLKLSNHPHSPPPPPSAQAGSARQHDHARLLSEHEDILSLPNKSLEAQQHALAQNTKTFTSEPLGERCHQAARLIDHTLHDHTKAEKKPCRWRWFVPTRTFSRRRHWLDPDPHHRQAVRDAHSEKGAVQAVFSCRTRRPHWCRTSPLEHDECTVARRRRRSRMKRVKLH